MSVADAPTPATTPYVVRRPVAAVSPRFLRSELRLMLGRRRNQAGLLVLAAVPVLISVSVKSSLSKPGADAPDFFRSITENGLFVALAALTIEMGLFLPLAVAVVAGGSNPRGGHNRTPPPPPPPPGPPRRRAPGQPGPAPPRAVVAPLSR